MKEKLVEFVEEQLRDAERWCNTYEEVIAQRGIAFGAIQFSINAGIVTYEEVTEWWEGESGLWARFMEVAKYK